MPGKGKGRGESRPAQCEEGKKKAGKARVSPWPSEAVQLKAPILRKHWKEEGGGGGGGKERIFSP